MFSRAADPRSQAQGKLKPISLLKSETPTKVLVSVLFCAFSWEMLVMVAVQRPAVKTCSRYLCLTQYFTQCFLTQSTHQPCKDVGVSFPSV